MLLNLKGKASSNERKQQSVCENHCLKNFVGDWHNFSDHKGREKFQNLTPNLNQYASLK